VTDWQILVVSGGLCLAHRVRWWLTRRRIAIMQWWIQRETRTLHRRLARLDRVTARVHRALDEIR